MPRMKWGDNFDADALDDEEFDPDEEGGFDPYDGPIPPKNTLLKGKIKKVWALESGSGNPMFKVLFEASGNTGDKEDYNGLPIWENVVWVPQNKWRWGHFLTATGIPNAKTVRERTVTATDDDNVGTPVLKVGKVDFTKGLEVRVMTGAPDDYNGEEKATVGRWMEKAQPKRSSRAAATDDDDEDDDPPF